MKKNKKLKAIIPSIFVLIFIFVVAFIIGYLYFYKLQLKNNYLILRIQSINEKDREYTISAEYPIFNNAQKEFNNKIQKNIYDKIKWFKDQIAENQKYRSDVIYSFKFWWEPKQLNRIYISFIIRETSFTGGVI